jgi:hypothetical protein
VKIGELFVELGFKADTLKLKEFVHAIGELNMSSVMGAVGLGTAYEAIRKIMGAADETALSINNFGLTTGQSTKEIQRWGKWAEQMGLNADVVKSSVNNLLDSVTRLKISGEGAPTWNLLGIDPTKFTSMFDLLKALRESLKGTPIEWQRLMLSQLGLSQDLLIAFNKTDTEWQRINEQFALGNTQLEKMAEFHKVNVELGQRFADIWVNIAPLMSKPLNVLDRFLIDLEKATTTFSAKDWGRVGYDFARMSPLASAIMGLTGTGAPTIHKTEHNSYQFRILSDDPQEAARKVAETLKQERKRAEFNSPAGNY